MGSTRRGGGAHVSAQQYLSIRSTDIILPSRLNSPDPGSSPSLSYVSRDTTFPPRHKKQPWKRLCCNPRLESLPNTSATQPRSRRRFPRPTPANSPFVPTIMLHFILDKLNCVSALRPLQDSPSTTYSRSTRPNPATCHAEPKYLKQPVPRGTYRNTLYSIHSRYIYSFYQHTQPDHPTGYRIYAGSDT